MVTCAVLDDYQGVALTLADWSGLAVRTYRERFAGHDDLVAAIAGCEVVVIMRERTPFPASLFARLPNLRLLVTSGMRNASIDLAAAREHGVTVCGTASSSTPPAELTWALILGLTRQIAVESASIRANGPWQQTIGTDLHGSTLGVIGLGKIGTQVARVGQAFGMNVTAWSENLTPERAAASGVRLATSKSDLLETADIVSVHVVLSPRTRSLISGPDLARMRPTSYLVNTSRAAIVDQDALITALREGRIAGAALDVFDTEPLPHDHPFRTLPNVLATPHLGYVTRGNYTTYFREAVEDIHAYLTGAPIRRL
ncbi:D-2-hydroxyacid dehydrogenase family protein [Nonomuraea sp. NPDC059007]|uniref:D-2-hydroxyacid dehydrogenase family protein n=1 Tax=Nonomuraea sp. NPDC059007 TaxID=3346692 RepID=UPI00368C4AD4